MEEPSSLTEHPIVQHTPTCDLPTSPKVVLDQTFERAHDIVEAVKILHSQQDEADRKVNKEIRAHAETKHKIKVLEGEQVQARENAELEAQTHLKTKEKLFREDRAHTKTKDAWQAAKDDVASMRLQMDAMKVEMEAQRKAFVINVNWAARCTELKTKFDQSCYEYDKLLEEHVQAKTEMDCALRTQEEFRMKHQTAQESHAVTQEQVSKNAADITARKELGDEIATKLAQLDEWKEKEERDIVQKKLGSQQALSVMQRSLAKGDKGIITSAFQGWSTLTVTEKKKRIQKDKVMQRTLKQIATEGMAVVAETFHDWHSETSRSKRAALAAAQARLEEASGSAGTGAMTGRQRAIAQLEKQFAGEDRSLLQSTFQGWAMGQNERRKKENNHKKASRMIANSGQALVAEVFDLWNQLTEKRRKKRKHSEQNMKTAGRMIANNDKILCREVMNAWVLFIEQIKNKRRVNEAGTAKGMRMIANSQASLMNLIFDSWMKLFKNGKKKDAGNKKALRMMADSNQAILIEVWKGWAGARENTKSKDNGTSKAMRMINNSSEALQAAVFKTWATDVSKNRDRNKKIRALEKSFGAQDAGKKMVVFQAWQTFTKVEVRKKKQKETAMKSSIKTITGNQDLLICYIFLAWGRCANLEKSEKKQREIKDLEADHTVELDTARVAAETDLANKQAEVARMKEDLETKKREKDEYDANLDGLQSQLEKSESDLTYAEKEVKSLAAELEQSRRRAVDIGQELGKVGVYVAAHTPRKFSRSGSGSRPGSGNKSVGKKLPPISGSNSRPDSGSKFDGSKSARGVAGERGGSARRDGRPPRSDTGDSLPERRYLIDGSGPFTYGQFEDIYGDKGQDNIVAQWNAAMPEYLPNDGFGVTY
jgi:hypothetical protein